jgi:hypothetical protein
MLQKNPNDKNSNDTKKTRPRPAIPANFFKMNDSGNGKDKLQKRRGSVNEPWREQVDKPWDEDRDIKELREYMITIGSNSDQPEQVRQAQEVSKLFGSVLKNPKKNQTR